MVSMTDSLFYKINAELAEWNPIGVHTNLALGEYEMYVPLLLAAYDEGQDVETFLRWVYEERIGFAFHDGFWGYSAPVAARITALLKAHEKVPL